MPVLTLGVLAFDHDVVVGGFGGRSISVVPDAETITELVPTAEATDAPAPAADNATAIDAVDPTLDDSAETLTATDVVPAAALIA